MTQQELNRIDELVSKPDILTNDEKQELSTLLLKMKCTYNVEVYG